MTILQPALEVGEMRMSSDWSSTMEDLGSAPRPHVVVLPFGALGHVRPLVQLARRLAHVHGVKVTFAVTSYFYKRMDVTDPKDGIRFVDLEDGFPDDYYHMRAVKALAIALKTLGPALRALLGRLQPVTCVISDQVFDEAHQAAVHLGIPSVAFAAQSAMAMAAKYYGRHLIDAGLLPLPKHPAERTEAMSQVVTSVPGMQPMKLSDYHTGLWVDDVTDPFFQFVIGENSRSLHERKWVLVNSVYELEAPLLEAFQADTGVRFTTVGPLAITPLAPNEPVDVTQNDDNRTSSIWPEETTCMDWLDKQDPASVVYVSFGSLAVMDSAALEELLLGLEESRVPFLMVVRPDQRQSSVQAVLGRTKGRALFVSWAPQLRVLSHPAVAGFLTHGGWNSFLESAAMGVPLLCHPFFLDQPMISRYIASVWNLGLELKRPDGSLQRTDVAKKVIALTAQESRIRTNAMAWKETLRRAVESGGSSHDNLAGFVADIYRRAKAGSGGSPPSS